jgi:hypothetical protein
VLDAFGDEAQHFVFVGGCVLGLYARAQGAPLRVTKDVDCISTRTPWVLQEQTLAEMCARGVLTPVPEVQCKYLIKGTDIEVDVLSPQGFNVGGVNPWFERASAKARLFPSGDDRSVNAVTPPYFLATKLVAFEDRGPDALESKDLEDIIALTVEVNDLVQQVDAAGIRADVAELWVRAFKKYGLKPREIPDFVDAHLHRDDEDQRDHVIDMINRLVAGDVRQPGLIVRCGCGLEVRNEPPGTPMVQCPLCGGQGRTFSIHHFESVRRRI